MGLYKLSFFPFKESLSAPVVIYDNSITYRKGYYIFISSLLGDVLGIGEIAPLPYLSKESYDDIQQYCLALNETSIEIFVDSDSYILDWSLFPNYPSFQFGLDSACIMAFRKPKNVLINSYYFNSKLPVYESLSDFPVLKCKVGHLNNKTEIDCIHDILASYPDIKFRFDVNGRFSLNQANNFFSKIPLSCIDYVEDPCSDIGEYESFYNKTGVKYALDYSLMLNTDLSIKGLKTLVVKPTCIGRSDTIRTLMDRYPLQNVVFSSSYETLVGLNNIALFASFLSPNEFHGVNTETIFSYCTIKKQHLQWNILDSVAINSWIFRG